MTTNLGAIPLLGRGKVRDLYAVNGDLLLVATDRISAFDHVLGSGIPDKGKILTQISLFWFDLFKDLVPNHLITADVREFPAALRTVCRSVGRPLHAGEAGRYVSGGMRGARIPGRIGLEGVPDCGNGLRHSACRPGSWMARGFRSRSLRRPQRPRAGCTTRTFLLPRWRSSWARPNAAELRDLTLAIYGRASAHAKTCGLILADTKFEFGKTPEGVILADEVLTPDSSRFWDGNAWKPGGRAAFVR